MNTEPVPFIIGEGGRASFSDHLGHRTFSILETVLAANFHFFPEKLPCIFVLDSRPSEKFVDRLIR